MIAIDTNVLVRLIVEDDPARTVQARVLLAGARVYVPVTVLLEASWVLQDTFALTRAEAHTGLSSVLGLANVTPEAPERVQRALAWMKRGMGLADALHLAAAEGCESFASFDRHLLRETLSLQASPPVRAP